MTTGFGKHFTDQFVRGRPAAQARLYPPHQAAAFLWRAEQEEILIRYEEALTKAEDAAAKAQTSAAAFDEAAKTHAWVQVHGEPPPLTSTTGYLYERAVMYTQVAQAWAAVAQTISVRGREQLEAGL